MPRITATTYNPFAVDACRKHLLLLDLMTDFHDDRRMRPLREGLVPRRIVKHYHNGIISE